MNWIIENIGLLTDKIFIPIIVAIITSVIGTPSKYKINYRFFVNLIIGIVIASILNKQNNIKDDIELSVKIYAMSIVCTFLLMIILNALFDFILKRIRINIKVHQLTIDECEYVVKCKETKQYFEVRFNTYPEFIHQWEGILYLEYGSKIAVNEDYRIFVNPYALKRVRKKLAAVKKNEAKI